jgi:hypothetical protein
VPQKTPVVVSTFYHFFTAKKRLANTTIADYNANFELYNGL